MSISGWLPDRFTPKSSCRPLAKSLSPPDACTARFLISKSGANNARGSLYDYLRNNKLDAVSILSAPGFNVLRQNQFGGAIGGPIRKDKTFIFANYEGQRRTESPTYNSTVLTNIAAINNA